MHARAHPTTASSALDDDRVLISARDWVGASSASISDVSSSAASAASLSPSPPLGLLSDNDTLRSHLLAREAQQEEDKGTTKALVFLLTTILLACVLLSLKGRDLLSEQRMLLFLYIQPLLPAATALWLWGVNVSVWDAYGVNFRLCFDRDKHHIPSSTHVFLGAATVTAVTCLTAVFFTYACESGMLGYGLRVPVVGYLFILTLILAPRPFPGYRYRHFLARTLRRVFLPLHSVTFADFLLADILTSLPKTLADFEQAVCISLSSYGAIEKLGLRTFTKALDEEQLRLLGPVAPPSLSICGNGSPLIPLCLSLPYLIRLIQCLRVHKARGDRAQLFNALKYSTAFPVIWLSALKFRVATHTWDHLLHRLWLLSALLNASYCAYWDLERDWGFPVLTKPAAMGRLLKKGRLPDGEALMFDKSLWLYRWSIASNTALRLAWVYKLSSHLRHNQRVVLLVSMLEVWRRFQWTFLRIETELRRLGKEALEPVIQSEEGTSRGVSVASQLQGNGNGSYYPSRVVHANASSGKGQDGVISAVAPAPAGVTARVAPSPRGAIGGAWGQHGQYGPPAGVGGTHVAPRGPVGSQGHG